MSRFTRFFAGLLLTSAAVTTPVSAALVLDLNTGGSANSCGACGDTGTTYGWAFRVNNEIAINQLGVWDAGANGLGIASVAAGLWRADGSLLASATITDASEQVTSASTDGEWLFADIGMLVLTPGSYVIGSVFTTDYPLAQVGAPFTAIAEIAVAGGVRGAQNAGLSFAGDSFSSEIFGPTMRLADAVVPEPSALALVGLGLVIAAAARRRALRGSAGTC